MAANGEFVSIQTVGLGVDRTQDCLLNFVPDFSGVDLSVIDFTQVRDRLGMNMDTPLHVLSDLDMTLRHNYATEMDEEIVRNVQEQLANGAITSFHIATNNRDPGVMLFGEQISPDTQVFAPAPSESGKLIRKQNGLYYERIVGALGIANEAAVVVGDKYRRDVLGGNRAGLFTMHVMPLPGPDMWFDRFGLRAWDNRAGELGHRAMTSLVARPAIADTI